jgi:hypothetical protein
LQCKYCRVGKCGLTVRVRQRATGTGVGSRRILSTKGAEKRRQHGSKGATVFRDPNEADRVWVLFDWDADGWQSFVSDPDVPPIMQEAGHKGRPQAAGLGGTYDA